MEHIIQIKDFHKQYGKENAVDGISLNIKKGTIFGLLGPNGAGKTTTIKAMTGRLNITSGSISVMGMDVQKDMKELHHKIGVVKELPNLYLIMTVFENIDFFRQLYNLTKDKTMEIIKVLSLEDHKDKKVSELSKGLKQRVLLARSIIHSPDILFLDEPTSGLDPHSAQDVYRFIQKIRDNGTTIFLTTHYMDEADLLCDQIAFINKGKIVAEGTPKSLKSRYGNNSVEVIYQLDDKEESKIFALDADNPFNQINELHNSHNVLSVHSMEATMHDVFIRLVQDMEAK